MVWKIKAKLVLQLRTQGLSRSAISSPHGMSRHSIQSVLDAADRAGLGWDDVAEISEGEVYAALFPGRRVRESVFVQPDWPRVHRELARVGVTLKQRGCGGDPREFTGRRANQTVMARSFVRRGLSKPLPVARRTIASIPGNAAMIISH
jgi:hypothetical protein